MMSRNDLMGDVENSYQSLKQLIQETNDLLEQPDLLYEDADDDYGDDDDYLQSLIDYNVNDVLSTPLPRNDFVEIQIGDVSEDVRRNAVVNVRNYTRDMDFKDVKNILLDYDGIVDIGEILHYFDLENLIIKNVDIFAWYNVLPNCIVGTIRFENCELNKNYSVRALSDDVKTSLDFIFEKTDSIGKIECVNCPSDFVDVLLLGVDKIDEGHRFGDIEIEIE